MTLITDPEWDMMKVEAEIRIAKLFDEFQEKRLGDRNAKVLQTTDTGEGPIAERAQTPQLRPETGRGEGQSGGPETQTPSRATGSYSGTA
jgi:hypothetical protein